LFTGNTDPYPYIIAAYSVGFIAILGYSCWVLAKRKSMREILTVIEKEGS
jgi:hypothetical protein